MTEPMIHLRGEKVEVQWHQGANVRNGHLYGITKVHIMDSDTHRTLCSRSVPRRSRWISPDDTDARCLRCLEVDQQERRRP